MTVAVITGAAGGIGAGLAREAVRRGMRVVLADRDEVALAEIVRGIGDAASAVPTDVTDLAAMEALADKAYALHGQVDLLFNNAGIMHTGNSWEIPVEQWHRSWAVNVEGVLNGLRAFVPRLIAADRPARIVNTASTGGFLPAPLMAPYSATKFAVVALTESLAGELQALGAPVAVSLLAPGAVKSGIMREAPSEASAAFHKVMTDALDAMGMTGDEFAPLVFDAIERGEYWIFTHPDSLIPGFTARNRQILDGQPPQFFLLDENV